MPLKRKSHFLEEDQNNYFIYPKIKQDLKPSKIQEISNLVSFVSQDKNDKSCISQQNTNKIGMGNDLQTIIDQYEKLSKEQIEKWKFFYNKINEMNQKKNNNPLIDQIKRESIKTIEYLLGKNSNQLKKKYRKSRKDLNQKKVFNEFHSFDKKSQERFILPDESVQHKHNYDLLKYNLLQNRISKSLVLPKFVSEKSSEIFQSKQNKKVSKKNNQGKRFTH